MFFKKTFIILLMQLNKVVQFSKKHVHEACTCNLKVFEKKVGEHNCLYHITTCCLGGKVVVVDKSV